MNSLTLYVCPGAPCPSWPTPPPLLRPSPGGEGFGVRVAHPRKANHEKQKNERTNPIPPNPNQAILVQRNFTSVPGATDAKPPSILHFVSGRPGPAADRPRTKPVSRGAVAGQKVNKGQIPVFIRYFRFFRFSRPARATFFQSIVSKCMAALWYPRT